MTAVNLRFQFVLAAVAVCAVAGQTTAEPVNFDRDIRSILSDNCFKCHGPDGAERKADLRLDTRAGAIAKNGDCQAIVPGKSAESALYQRITSQDADERMPPVDSGK